MDFILNGAAQGSVASRLLSSNLDPNCLRPYVGEDGRSYITANVNGVPTPTLTANTATLRKDEWMLLDQAVIRAAKPRLRATADLIGSGLTYNLPNGMGHTVLQQQTMGDITPATTSMDGLRRGENDVVELDLRNLPLPIIHKDFEFTLRQLATSRNNNTPLDMTYAELAGRRVAEEVEKLLLGVSSSFAYGGGTVYGYTNYPNRNTKVLTLPTANGWTGSQLVTEVIQMREQAIADNYFGPYVLYTAPNFSAYLDEDYSAAKGDNTLRERIAKIEGISAVRTLDYLTGWQMVLVQMTSDVVREVIGMNIQTLQWAEEGGMLLKYKVMCIMVPQLRSDSGTNTGIVHGTAA